MCSQLQSSDPEEHSDHQGSRISSKFTFTRFSGFFFALLSVRATFVFSHRVWFRVLIFDAAFVTAAGI